MRQIAAILFTITAVAHLYASTHNSATLDKAIATLDSCLEHREYFTQARMNEIELEKAELYMAEPDKRTAVLQHIAGRYVNIDIDSALTYYTQALNTATAAGDTTSSTRIRLSISALLPIGGYVHEALDIFDDITAPTTDTTQMRAYERSAGALYLNIAATLPDGFRKQEYLDCAELHIDRLASLYASGTFARKFIEAQLYLMRGEKALAQANLSEIIPYIAEADSLPEPGLMAKATAMMAEYYNGQPAKGDLRLYYLATSATNDLLDGTRDCISLRLLGKEFFERGDIQRAYACEMAASDNAIQFGSLTRLFSNPETLPAIAETFRRHDNMHISRLRFASWALAICAAIIAALVSLLMHGQRRSGAIKQNLNAINASKDIYIQNILNLCSLYVERLDEFNRLVGRKIKTGQVQDLYNNIESGKYIREQTEKFYEAFDETFFNIYPNFINEINTLLLPDKKITLSAPRRLTPELRIVAFARLGIEDSSKISQFLGLSLNTIYTYRNRLKGRAINRDTFDSDIRRIGGV